MLRRNPGDAVACAPLPFGSIECRNPVRALAACAALVLAGHGGPHALADEEHFVAVATSPPPKWSFEADEMGYYGLAWNTESAHDAGEAAESACRRQGGENCFYTASGQSMRGGCVGIAVAGWRDQEREPTRAYLTASSNIREVIARDLRGACSVAVFAGKPRERVVEHSCEVIEILCAEDVDAATVASTPAPRSDSGLHRSDAAAELPSACDAWNTVAFFQDATLQSVQACLDGGVDPNARVDDEHTGPTTPLALSLRRPEVAGVLLDAGARVDGRDHPLARAVSPDLHGGGHTQASVEVVDTLLKRGADPNRGSSRGVTDTVWPLGAAMPFGEPCYGHPANRQTVRIVDALLAAGADPNKGTTGMGSPLAGALGGFAAQRAVRSRCRCAPSGRRGPERGG